MLSQLLREATRLTVMKQIPSLTWQRSWRVGKWDRGVTIRVAAVIMDLAYSAVRLKAAGAQQMEGWQACARHTWARGDVPEEGGAT